MLETSRGNIVFDLFPDIAPKTVARFSELVKKGFYNGLVFYRVLPKFIVQTGDPSADGTGGSGQSLPAEFNERKHIAGTVGMARRHDPDSADSQFYICLEPQPFLDGKYTVFGQVIEGLELLSKIQERDPVLKNTTNKLADSVQGGSTFSESLAQYPIIFNDLYVNMVKAGEVGGVLELVLTRLAEFQEKAAKIKNKVAAAMVYPLIVMTMAVTIMGFLLVFIVPKFEAIFHDMLGGKPLPIITTFVITVSRFVQGHWLVILALIFAAVAGYKFANRTPRGKSTIDGAKLRFPLFGDIIRKTAVSRFTRTLGTLVTSGVPILQALNITRETAGNMVIARAIGQVHESVKEGESIVQPLEASAAFPPMVVSMIDVGEETGQLPEMLLKIADVYDDEVDNSVAAMTAALEPIMIVFLAVVVGTIVIALFLPLISIIQELQQQT